MSKTAWYAGIDWYSGTIALLALVFAAWTFARQRKSELRPKLELELQVVAKGTALRVTSLGPLDYDSVRLRIVPPPDGLRWPIEAVMHRGEWAQEVDLGPMGLGEFAEVLLKRDEDGPAEAARLLFVCRKGLRRWRIPVTVRFEATPTPWFSYG
jgi:hypothetical protein